MQVVESKFNGNYASKFTGNFVEEQVNFAKKLVEGKTFAKSSVRILPTKKLVLEINKGCNEYKTRINLTYDGYVFGTYICNINGCGIFVSTTGSEIEFI